MSFEKNFVDLRNPKKETFCYICGKTTKGTGVVVNDKGIAHFSCAVETGEI